MIHPSYVDLMKVVNKNVEEGETPVINSRYSIVMATAKRARQIVDGDEPLVKVSRGEKPLSIAVDELNQEEIRILAEDEVEEEYTEFLEESAGAGTVPEEGAEEKSEETQSSEEEAETGEPAEDAAGDSFEEEEPENSLEEAAAGEAGEDEAVEEYVEEEVSAEDETE